MAVKIEILDAILFLKSFRGGCLLITVSVPVDDLGLEAHTVLLALVSFLLGSGLTRVFH